MDITDREKLDVEGAVGPQSEKTPAEYLPGGGGTAEPAYLDVDEKRLVRKLDMFLIPLVMALYLFSFLDR